MNLPYFQMYAKDWTSSETTRVMSFAEKGLYIDLLSFAWTNDGLPADPLRIARLAGADWLEFAALWEVVQHCFPVAVDGRRRNPRQEDERCIAEGKSAKASSKGKKGADSRWGKSENGTGNGAGIAQALPTHSVGMSQAMAPASESGSVSGSDSKNQESTNLREFRKPAPSPAESEPGDGVSVTGWTQAGFENAEAGEMWFQALVLKHPNRKGNTVARTAFLDRVLTGQFNRTEFERWYEEQVPIWQKWPMFPNLHSIFLDGEWRFPQVALPKPQKTDRERGLAG